MNVAALDKRARHEEHRSKRKYFAMPTKPRREVQGRHPSGKQQRETDGEDSSIKKAPR